MNNKLPENFVLPSNADLDAAVQGIDRGVKSEGDAALFLGKYRFDRRDSQSLYHGALLPFALQALQFEDTDAEGNRRSKEHRLANAVVSGMIFGHMVNEATHPDVLSVHRPYNDIKVWLNYMEPGLLSFASLGGPDTGVGRRFAYYAMSDLHLDALDVTSIQSIDGWASELIPSVEHRKDFNKGFGLSLYAAWDTYSDQLVADGRRAEVQFAGGLDENDQGGRTSI